MSLLCTHYKQGCSGCLFNENLAHPPIFNEVKDFFKIHFDKEISFSTGRLTGWRSRAKLAVRGTTQNPLIGLFKENSHEALPIPSCPMHKGPINEAVKRVRDWIIQEKIEPYNESGSGQIRYIQVTTNYKHEIQLVLVLTRPVSVKAIQGGWHSLWVNYNASKTNTIFSDKWQLIEGEAWLEESLNGKLFYFHPSTFVQANPEMYSEALRDMLTHFKGPRAVEFYGGVGTIGLTLLSKASSLLVTEYNPFSKPCFDKNNEHQKAQFKVIKAEEGASLLNTDTIILDPPRKGVDPIFLGSILQSDVKQVIYLSCGFEAFSKEALLFKKNGFNLTFAKGYLFFPGTNHIETLSIFERAA